MYSFLADMMVAIHLGYILYVLIGQILIFGGMMLRWGWIRNPWFRWSHLSMIGIVALEAIFGITCPLTDWEIALRVKAGQRRDWKWQADLVTSGIGHLGSWTGERPYVTTFLYLNGRPPEQTTFIGNLLRDVLFYDAPEGLLTSIYIGFAGITLLCLVLVPPWSRRNQ